MKKIGNISYLLLENYGRVVIIRFNSQDRIEVFNFWGLKNFFDIFNR